MNNFLIFQFWRHLKKLKHDKSNKLNACWVRNIEASQLYSENFHSKFTTKQVKSNLARAFFWFLFHSNLFFILFLRNNMRLFNFINKLKIYMNRCIINTMTHHYSFTWTVSNDHNYGNGKQCIDIICCLLELKIYLHTICCVFSTPKIILCCCVLHKIHTLKQKKKNTIFTISL